MIHRIFRFIKKHRTLLIALVFIAAFNSLFFVISPKTIVEVIGVENVYLTLFLIASFGGLNTFTSGVLYSSIAAFAAGGAAPWLLGVAGGLGIAVGDMIMYYLFRYGFTSVPERSQRVFRRYEERVRSWPRWVQYTLIYVYLGFSPFPNDILMFVLAVLRFRFLTILPLIVLGGVSIATIVAFLGESWPF